MKYNFIITARTWLNTQLDLKMALSIVAFKLSINIYSTSLKALRMETKDNEERNGSSFAQLQAYENSIHVKL